MFEIMCLRNLCYVKTKRMRHIIRGRCKCKLSTLKRTEQNALKEFEHAEIKKEDVMVKRMYRGGVVGNRENGPG